MRDHSAHFDILKAYAHKLCPARFDDAEDLFQETLLKMYEHDDKFDGRFAVAWAATIMRNLLYSRSRSLYNKRRVPMPEDFEMAAPSHDPVEFSQTMQLLYSLPPVYRDVLIARAEGHNIAETAQLLSINEGTVKSRTTRARMRLLRALHATTKDERLDALEAHDHKGRKLFLNPHSMDKDIKLGRK